jgi:ATP-dependent helicase/nuclease subunit A
MEEFSRSRYRLESRYEHVLVDEFQDTSRAQWRLVRELVRAWAAGEGLSHGPIPPSIFIVGDRKQSIYGFRDAEVTVLDAAAAFVDALRPEAPARAAITRSYRSVHELLMFVNDVCVAIDKADRPDAFRYSEDDAFPAIADAPREADAIGVITADSDRAQAEAVAGEIARLLQERATIRDRHTGLRRPIGPGDIGVLFRTRESHALFEAALATRGVPYYVYKGLGFFDAEEIKDVLALVSYLADPFSNLRAAALLRSRIVRISDEGLKILAPDLAGAITGELPGTSDQLADDDRERLRLVRESAGAWIDLADQWPAAELIDRVLAESAYAIEIAGPGFAQARENLKKIRGLIRRIQNRGYATLSRLSDYFSGLVAGGDESNAIIDAADAVNLMTVHAAKGLEFPVVFIVNIGKGSGGNRDDVRVAPAPFSDDEDLSRRSGEAEEADEPHVTVSDHESASDRDDEKEVEETKRLLYVA